MNRKFIYISLSVFAISVAFILGFKFVLGNKVLIRDSVNFDQGEAIIKYVGFEEGEDTYKIKVSVKNNSDYYASFSDISLMFFGGSNGSPVFKGYDNDERRALMDYKEGDKYNFSPYFAANEEREYAFEVSKGLSFDKEDFDTNKINISYNVTFFRYKANKNTVISSIFSKSGTARLDNSSDPYVIK